MSNAPADSSATQPNSPGPDFSKIDSEQKALELVQRGELEKLLLLPALLGGSDIPENRIYVPVGLGKMKSGVDQNIIVPLAKQGKVTQYRAEPQYQGSSFIPIAIKVTAWNPGHFATTIRIWGNALKID